MNQWWDGLEAERYWMELTDREDLGADLRTPLTDDASKPNWRYLLFKTATVGDTVFHYDKNAKVNGRESRCNRRGRNRSKLNPNYYPGRLVLL